MTTKVTKESLAKRIQTLELTAEWLSINQEYQLEAYKMLLALMQPVKLPSGFSVGDNEDDPSYFNTWCYEVADVKEALTSHGLEFTDD